MRYEWCTDFTAHDLYTCVCVTNAALGGATSHSRMRWEVSRGNETKQAGALCLQSAREAHRSQNPAAAATQLGKKKKKGKGEEHNITQYHRPLSPPGRSPERLVSGKEEETSIQLTEKKKSIGGAAESVPSITAIEGAADTKWNAGCEMRLWLVPVRAKGERERLDRRLPSTS